MSTPFGYLVRQAREAKGLSQTDLARRLGISGAHLCRIERHGVAARASAALIARLLCALEVPPPMFGIYMQALVEPRAEEQAAA